MKKIVYILMMFVIAISAQAQTGTQARQILDKTAAVVGNKVWQCSRYHLC